MYVLYFTIIIIGNLPAVSVFVSAQFTSHHSYKPFISQCHH